MRVGLVYDRFGDAPRPPGAPPDWDAEYEPEGTVAALEAAVRHLGHEPVRIGNVPALLAAMARGPLGLDAAVSIAESTGGRNREAHAPVLLELAGVPAVFSDALTLSATLDKHLTKVVAGAAGVRVPPHAVLRPGAPADVEAAVALGFPLFVKPRYEGTAKGIAPSSRVETADALRAEADRQHGLYRQDLLAEAFVVGDEATIGVVGTGDSARALPLLLRAVEATTGIGLHALERHERPDAPFAYAVPGVLAPEVEAEACAAAVAVHRALGCADVSRSDFRVDRDGRVWFLEVNPLPTFAPDGTFAVLAELDGTPYPEFLAGVLARGLRRLGVGP
ncbi:MAG TPA: D-alanine--D-alanine ligase [Rubricoccaceae bacterium]